MPDPFLLALMLTVVSVVVVFAVVPHATSSGVTEAWFSGVWGESNIFAFAFEMVLILVTGHALAEAPLVRRGLEWLAARPTSQVQAALLCFGVAAVCSFLNWGLGLVSGALLARHIARRLSGIHFGYLIAASYTGFIVCNSGLSASVALANTDPKSPSTSSIPRPGTRSACGGRSASRPIWCRSWCLSPSFRCS